MTPESTNDIRVPDSELDYDEDLVYKYRDHLFTGIGYEILPGGGLSEVSYRDGIQDGAARDWYPGHILRSESMYRNNVLHGEGRELSRDGRVLMEHYYEYGILVTCTRYKSNGDLESRYELSVVHPNYRLLQRLRAENE